MIDASVDQRFPDYGYLIMMFDKTLDLPRTQAEWGGLCYRHAAKSSLAAAMHDHGQTVVDQLITGLASAGTLQFQPGEAFELPS